MAENPTKSEVYTAAIEWGDGTDASVIVGWDSKRVLAGVVELITAEAGDSSHSESAAFVSDHPAPDVSDEAAMRAWLHVMWEATTRPWVTLDHKLILGEQPVASH